MSDDVHSLACHEPLATTADGAIDEDLFCLACGYNLRGLSGNPVRCPECGENNDLYITSIPAPLITKALHGMETTLTTCVFASLLGLLAIAIFALSRGRAFPVVAVVAFVSLALWLKGWFDGLQAYENRKALRRLVLNFHVITVLCTAFLWLFVLLLSAGFGRTQSSAALAFWMSVLIAVPPFVMGVWLYRNCRKRIALLQRDRAVQIARDELRKHLQAKRVTVRTREYGKPSESG